MTSKQLQEEILKLKKKQDVTILAHYYQPLEIQEIADYLGDSLGLSQIAKEKVNSEYILFAGVIFMAETASILNQDKHVLIPSLEALCPMAAFLNPNQIIKARKKYPDHPVVTYVNSTAATKAESDSCCTSSNSVRIVEKISKEFQSEGVLFGPDSNLADYTERQSGVKCIKLPKEGHCYVHSQLTVNMLQAKKKEHPNAKILVHPECKREVIELADFTGSTAQMYKYVKEAPKNISEFIIGTEKGLMERMTTDFTDKTFYLLSDKLICDGMKKNTLEITKQALLHPDDKKFEIKVPSVIARKAIKPINKMLAFSK